MRWQLYVVTFLAAAAEPTPPQQQQQQPRSVFEAEAMLAERDGRGKVLMGGVSDGLREAMVIRAAESRVRRELTMPVPERGILKKYGPPGSALSVEKMIEAAVDWVLRTVPSSPVTIRDNFGMKGVKHFTEWLDVMRLAVARGNAGTKAKALAAVRDAVPQALQGKGYHSWMTYEADTYRFRQDSMSYLRAYYLCAYSDLGLNESHPELMAQWRLNVVDVLPKVWHHLSSRGIDQKLNFVKLFRALRLYLTTTTESVVAVDDSGNPLPVEGRREQKPLPTLEEIGQFEIATFLTTLIWRREKLGWYFVSPDRPYDITHEIFALTDDGRQPFPFQKIFQQRADEGAVVTADALHDDDLARFYAYARDIVATLLRIAMVHDNADLACEYVVNLGQLGVRAGKRPTPTSFHHHSSKGRRGGPLFTSSDDDDASMKKKKSPDIKTDDETPSSSGKQREDDDLSGLYLRAMEYIRSRRNADGSFGEIYDQETIRRQKRNPTYDVNIGGTLHTTYVCLWALTQPLYDDETESSWATNVPPTDDEHRALGGFRFDAGHLLTS